MDELLRDAWVEIDLQAVRENARVLANHFAPSQLCAVVKADGYGHGAVEVARAAFEGGAKRLAVALVEEGRQLRERGIRAPILVLSEPPLGAMSEVVAYRLTPAIYTLDGLGALADAVAERRSDVQPLHLKIDTGMHRVGCAPADAMKLVEAINATDGLALEGVFTHFAVADDPNNPFTDEQMRRFENVLAALRSAGIDPPLTHVANSSASITRRDTRMSMVRSGIALYGVAPSDQVALPANIRPVMSVKARVSLVKSVSAGESVSYGLRYQVHADTVIATVPLGYADGLPRSLGHAGGEVLIGGRRLPIAGTVTMDQFMVDCGPGSGVRAGDEVVIIGEQGADEITANEVGNRLGTIGYEIVTRIGPRLRRRYPSD